MKVKKMEAEKEQHDKIKEEMETMRIALSKKDKLCKILGEQAKLQTQ